MMRVASLANLSDRQLDRWIKRVALLAVVVFVGFGAFYVFDRWRMPAAPILDRQLTALEAAVQADPKDITSRGRLADLYTAKGRYEDAIAQYTAILKTGQADELAQFGRAKAYLLSGALDLATKDYQAVVDIARSGEMANVDPTLEAAYYSLGDISIRQGRPADAIPQLEKALKIKRSDADALLLIGKAYAATGQTDKAASALREAVSFVPIGWVEPYQVMADAYTKAGDAAMAEWAGAMVDFQSGSVDKAGTRLQALVGGKAALDAEIGLGLIAETRGAYASASTWYQKALAIDPANAAARLGLSRVGSSTGTASPTPASSALPTLPAPGQLPGGNG